MECKVVLVQRCLVLFLQNSVLKDAAVECPKVLLRYNTETKLPKKLFLALDIQLPSEVNGVLVTFLATKYRTSGGVWMCMG